jgi:hypothetical protein
MIKLCPTTSRTKCRILFLIVSRFWRKKRIVTSHHRMIDSGRVGAHKRRFMKSTPHVRDEGAAVVRGQHVAVAVPLRGVVALNV